MCEDIYNWDPLSPDDVCELFASLTAPWWISGGWAIDLFAGCQTRPHGDIDVLVLRRDQLKVQNYLSEWDLYKTQQPGLKPWLKGEFLKPGVNDVWCRRTPGSPWSLQLMLMETEEDSWVFRRDPAISGPLASLGKRTGSGIPYLSPEVQLLYKSNDPVRDKNRADFSTAVPLMSADALSWLWKCLQRCYPSGHQWIERLSQEVGERRKA